jgi:O-antigen/teichoic acid export membrane protein
MSLGRKITHAVSWLAVAQVAQRGTTLVVTAILARRLHPADFGLIALTLLSVNFMSYFQDLGLSAALVQRADLEADHLDTAFWINVTAGFALGLVGVALSPLISVIFREARLTSILMVMMITLPINGLGWASHSLLQRRLTFKKIAVVEWLSMFLSGITAIVLALLGSGVWALVAQNIVMAVVSAAGRLIAAGWRPGFSFSTKRFRELLSFSSGAFGYFLVNHGMRNIDNAIVGAVLGTTALGYYSLAYNLILMPGMTVCGIVGRVMFPALCSVQNEPSRFRQVYLRMARTITLATFPLIIGLGATASLFVTTIYGPQWAPAVPVLRILIVIGFFEGMTVWGPAAWARGQTKMSVLTAIISLISMAVAFSIGVRWGLTGVAWAYVAVSPIVFIVPHLWTNRIIGLPLVALLKAIGPALIAALVMGIVVSLVNLSRLYVPTSQWLSLVSYIALGGTIYAFVLLCAAVICGQRRAVFSWIIGGRLAELETSS